MIKVSFYDGHYTNTLLHSYTAMGSDSQVIEGALVKSKQKSKLRNKRLWVEFTRDCGAPITHRIWDNNSF